MSRLICNKAEGAIRKLSASDKQSSVVYGVTVTKLTWDEAEDNPEQGMKQRAIKWEDLVGILNEELECD